MKEYELNAQPRNPNVIWGLVNYEASRKPVRFAARIWY